jgi:hypothetical protein
VYLLPNAEPDVHFASDLFSVDVFMSESIAAQGPDSVVVGDALESQFFRSTEYGVFLPASNDVSEHTSWAYGGTVALASDGTTATIDPVWNTGLGAVIVTPPTSDSQIIFFNNPRAIAFDGAATTLVVAAGPDLIAYERSGDSANYEAGFGSTLAAPIDSIAVSQAGDAVVILYSGVGLCTPCFVDVVNITSRKTVVVRRSETCSGDTVSAGRRSFVACGKLFSFDTLEEEPIHGQPWGMDVLGVSQDDGTFLFGNTTSLELRYRDQPPTLSPSLQPTDSPQAEPDIDGSGDGPTPAPRRQQPIRKHGGSDDDGGGDDDDGDDSGGGGMSTAAVVAISASALVVCAVLAGFAAYKLKNKQSDVTEKQSLMRSMF